MAWDDDRIYFMEKVSVIIPTMKGREDLLAKLISTIPKDCEKIIVFDEKLSLSEKRNKGVAQSTGEYLLFIDDDNYIDYLAISKLVSYLKVKSVGIVGMMACYHDEVTKIADGGSRRFYLSGFTMGINTNKYVCDIDYLPYEVDEVANAFMIRRDLFKQLIGFDSYRFPIELDEADLCIRTKDLGYRILMCPLANCYHQSITYSRIPDFRRPKNAYFMGRNRIFYQKKHLKRMRFIVYLVAFLPLFVLSYCVSLIYRRKPKMIYHFLKGVYDGLRGRFQNSY
jgi:GT2 family glycosyltransferase